MVFSENVSYEYICFALANPLTSCGFLDTLRKKNAVSVAQNGASSAFGKIFIKHCAKEGIQTVNIVRKQQHIDSLKSLGANYVIDSSADNWESEFEALCKDLKITNFFDCVGGDMTGKCLKLLPENSTLYHFGNLELKRLGSIDTSDFIFKKKIMRGWWLLEWVQSLTTEEMIFWTNYITREFEDDSEVFKTTVSKSFPLEEFEKAFEYYIMNMSEGKIIIRPNHD